MDSSDDHNSYWKVNGKIGSDCIRGLEFIISVVSDLPSLEARTLIL